MNILFRLTVYTVLHASITLATHNIDIIKIK
jgi:hypothetical protein